MRRTSGRGFIKQRAQGTWSVVVPLPKGPDGKRRQQWVTVRGTRKEAEKKLAELLHQLDTGTFVKPTKLTVAEFLEQWLKDYAWPNVAPRTAEGYEHIIRQHLVPGLGFVVMSQLAPQHLQSYYADKLERGRLNGKGGLSPRTVRHHHVTLHTALQSAVKWGLLARNPADAVDAPRWQPKDMRTFDDEGLRRFLEAARSTPYYPLFYVDLFTGLRRSELLALRWDDVDLMLGQVSITRSLHHLRNGSTVFRAPKTKKGRRMVALPPSAILVLKQHREQDEALREELGLPQLEGNDLVFARLDGAAQRFLPLLPDSVTQAWGRLVRRAGFAAWSKDGQILKLGDIFEKHANAADRAKLDKVKGDEEKEYALKKKVALREGYRQNGAIRLHDARHTHATMMLKQGVHPKVVQERLGHATIAVTLDTYSHVVPGLQEAAALQFDAVMNGDAPAPKREPKGVG